MITELVSDTIPIGILILDKKQNVHWKNRAACEIMNLEQDGLADDLDHMYMRSQLCIEHNSSKDDNNESPCNREIIPSF